LNYLHLSFVEKKFRESLNLSTDTNIKRRIFLRGPSIGARLILFITLSLIIMVLDTRYNKLEEVRRVISTAVYPLRAIAHAPYHFTSDVSDSLRTRKQLRIENENLKQRMQDATYDLQRVHRLETENNRLRALLETAEQQQLNLQMTEIMRVSLNPNRHHVILNQGELSDIKKGQAVIDAQGLIGQIIRTDPMQSEVVLLTDTNHATPVEINRNGLRSIAYGTGEIQSLNLPYFPQNADLIEGDILITSGLGGRFPAGIPVAEIIKIDRDTTKNFLTVKAIPMAALEQSRQVAIVHESAQRIAQRRNRSGSDGIALANKANLESANASDIKGIEKSLDGQLEQTDVSQDNE